METVGNVAFVAYVALGVAALMYGMGLVFAQSISERLALMNGTVPREHLTDASARVVRNLAFGAYIAAGVFFASILFAALTGQPTPSILP